MLVSAKPWPASPPASRRTSRRATPRGPTNRPPGRPPAGAPDLRQSLLDAARSLFIVKGFGNVGTRELARAAGVSPAMIPYYFGDKQGLYEALVEDAIGHVLARLQSLAAHGGDRREDPVDAFLTAYLDTLIAEPWIPQLLVREVLAARLAPAPALPRELRRTGEEALSPPCWSANETAAACATISMSTLPCCP